MGLTKARIVEKEQSSNFIEFQFNPQTIQFKKSAVYSRTPNQAGKGGPSTQFKGTGPTTLSLKMIIDDVESGKVTVLDKVDQLLAWTEPSDKSKSKTKPAPPQVEFRWGGLRLGSVERFLGFVTDLTITYDLFDPTGEPIRSTVEISLSTERKDDKGQNPTSGAPTSQRTHVVRSGDSLASIAHSFYGSAGRWRAIAIANRIENPASLRPGSTLRIPYNVSADGF